MKKTLLLLLCLLTWFVVGCASDSKPLKQENTANVAYSVTDDRGKVFNFTEPPKRILTTSLKIQA